MAKSSRFWVTADDDALPDLEVTFQVPRPPRPTRQLAAERPSLQALFLRHYASIRRWLERARPPGLAVLALDDEGVRGFGWLAARQGAINTAILGRHPCVDIPLGGDPELSLRHVALILFPADDGGMRFRAMDLRTGQGFRDEAGRRLDAVEGDGPMLLRCASYAVFIAPLAQALDWPDDPMAAWEALPPRVFQEAATPAGDLKARWPGQPHRAARGRLEQVDIEITGVVSMGRAGARPGRGAAVGLAEGRRHGAHLGAGHPGHRAGPPGL